MGYRIGADVKIGDLVTSRSPRFPQGVQGVVIDITKHEEPGRFDTVHILVIVLWNTGELYECASWDLTIEETL